MSRWPVGCRALSSSSRSSRPPTLRPAPTGSVTNCAACGTGRASARAPSGKGVRNGTRGVVQAIDCQLPREVTLATSDGRSVRLPADYVERHRLRLRLDAHKDRARRSARHSGSDAATDATQGLRVRLGAEGLSAEAALVRRVATESTELFVLEAPDETASLGDGDEELGRAWEPQRAAATRPRRARDRSEIARLAGTSREALGTSATRSFR